MQSIMSSYSRVCLVPTGYKHEFSVTLKKINCFFRELGCWNSFRDFLSAFFFLGQDIIIWKHLFCDLWRPPIGFPPTQKSRQQKKPRKFKPLQNDWSAQTQPQSFFFSGGNVWMWSWHEEICEIYTKGLTHLLLCRSKETLHLKVLHALPHILQTPANSCTLGVALYHWPTLL